MRNFNQGGGSRFGGGNRGGGARFVGGRHGGDRGPVTMHQAICSKCGKECEVPFRPTGDKPIYCNDCFGANRDRGEARGGDRFPRKDFGSRAPVRPSFGENRGGGNDDVKKQLEFLGLKIDRLTKVVEGLIGSKSSAHKEKNIEVNEVLQDLSVIKKTKTKVPAKKATPSVSRAGKKKAKA
jgi:CxxC-x17-CxxC domain-containing protein